MLKGARLSLEKVLVRINLHCNNFSSMREKKTKKVKKYLTFELKYINIMFVRLIHNQETERKMLDENHIKSC